MIKVYSIDSCEYCTELKERLDAKGITYEVIDVDLPENEDEFAEIMKVTSSDLLPTIVVGTQILVPDVSFESIEEAAETISKLDSENQE